MRDHTISFWLRNKKNDQAVCQEIADGRSAVFQVRRDNRNNFPYFSMPGRVAQSVGHLTGKSRVLGSIPGLATYFRFSFRFFKKGSCQLLAKVCARSTR